jgi:hypothetical protein
VRIGDVSTAGQEVVAPGCTGKIKRATSCLGGAISGADAGLTLKISGTAVTGGTITIANGSSAMGDVDECIPTGANHFTPADHIEIETDGASTGTQPVTVVLELDA